MPSLPTSPNSSSPTPDVWRFAFTLLSSWEWHNSTTLPPPWDGPDSEYDLQLRVSFLASSLGCIPLGSRDALPRIVVAWHEARPAAKSFDIAQLRRISRECIENTKVASISTQTWSRAAIALGCSTEADMPARAKISANARQVVDSAVSAWLKEISDGARWLKLPLLGGADALPLDDVHVELLVQAVGQSDELASDYAREGRRDQRQPFALGLSIQQVLARSGRQVLIIGEPGAGKSTTIKWIVRAIATGRFVEFDASIAVSLGAYAESLTREGACSLLAYFLRTHLPPGFVAPIADLEAAAQLLCEANRTHNRTLLLLDGWDEVSPQARDQVRERVLTANRSFVTLITSRPSGVPQRFVAQSHGTAFRFIGLSPRGIQQLASRVFSQCGRPELASEFLELLRNESDLEAFVRNPFLNTLICFSFAQTQRETLLELARMPARLFDRITEWIAAQHNGREGTKEPLGAKHWRVLQALAQDLLVTSPNPRYFFRKLQLDDIAAEEGVSAGPIIASRFVHHIGTSSDEHSFLHATLQEYFAARALDEEFQGDDYVDVIMRLLPSQEYAEVLRFAAGAERHRSEFWKCVREWGTIPDRFQQVFCQQARLVAASGSTDGGQGALGRDVRQNLWEAISDSLQHPIILEQCVYEYISLDAADLVRRTLKGIDSIPDFSLQFILLNAPRAIASKQRLYEEVDKRRADFRGWTNPRAVSFAEVERCRKELQTPDLPLEQMRDLCWELGNYRDELSAGHIIQLLKSRAELPQDVFENIVFALAAIGTREALHELIELLFKEGPPSDCLWRIQSELRQPHVLDPESRDSILRRIASLPNSDPRVAIGLNALAGLPLHHAAELLRSVLADQSADRAARLAAAQCLEHDRTPEFFQWIAKHLADERDVEIQNALIAAAGNCEVSSLDRGQCDWLISRARTGSNIEQKLALSASIELARGNELPWLHEELRDVLDALLPQILADSEHTLAPVVWSAADFFNDNTLAKLRASMTTRPVLATPKDVQHQRSLVAALSAAASKTAVPLLQQLLDHVLQMTAGNALARRISHDDPDSMDTQCAMLAQDVARALAELDPTRLLKFPKSCRPVQVALQSWAEAHGHVVYSDYILNSRGTVIAGTRPTRLAARSLKTGKMIIVLSGGGLRATLFHLGIFVWLAENNRLKDILGIVSVSGGSILSAHLAKHWQTATENKNGFRGVAAMLVKFARRNLRDRVLIRWLWSRVWFCWFKRSLSRSEFLRRGYQEHFGDTTLGVLKDANRPRIAIVATDAIKQERVVFMADELIRIPLAAEARSTSIEPRGTDLALAVTASSCFPPVFSRMHLDHRDLNLPYRDFKDTLSLNDGGVAGNLGIEVLLALRHRDWNGEETVIVGDAERPQTVKPSDSLGTDLGTQAAALSQGSREILKAQLGERGRIISFAGNIKNGSGLPFKAETKLFGMRTDLDGPSWQEIHALLIHGALSAAQANGDAPDPTEVATIRASVLKIIEEAGGPKELALPVPADLEHCHRRPIARIGTHACIVAVIIAMVFGLATFGALCSWGWLRADSPAPNVRGHGHVGTSFS
jgi:predicted acylesterase/phospholipase RssA